MTVKAKAGGYYQFGSYATKGEALRAASVLRKHGHVRAHVKKNAKTKEWDTMYAGVRKS